jgi:hypothetical protein
MSIYTEESVYLPEVVESGCIQVKRIDRVLKDGMVISTRNNRHVLAPGDDLTNEDPIVQAVAKAVWTDEVIANYKMALSTKQF